MNEVFYVCYGSNLHENRFREYLSDDWTYYTNPDDWEKSLTNEEDSPLVSYRVNLTHDVFFAGHSGRWGGGIAYLDVDSFSCKKVYRAYKIPVKKFESLFSQENGYYSGPFKWDHILNKRETRTDAGWYGRIVNLGTIDGIPALTFTSNHSYADFEDYTYSARNYRGSGIRTLNSPGQPYVDVIDRGRAETRKLQFKEIVPLS